MKGGKGGLWGFGVSFGVQPGSCLLHVAWDDQEDFARPLGEEIP